MCSMLSNWCMWKSAGIKGNNIINNIIVWVIPQVWKSAALMPSEKLGETPPPHHREPTLQRLGGNLGRSQSGAVSLQGQARSLNERASEAAQEQQEGWALQGPRERRKGASGHPQHQARSVRLWETSVARSSNISRENGNTIFMWNHRATNF